MSTSLLYHAFGLGATSTHALITTIERGFHHPARARNLSLLFLWFEECYSSRTSRAPLFVPTHWQPMDKGGLSDPTRGMPGVWSGASGRCLLCRPEAELYQIL